MEQSNKRQYNTIVFTYGTLKQGFYNNYHLKEAVYLGKAELNKEIEGKCVENIDYFSIVIDHKWYVPYLFPNRKIQEKNNDKPDLFDKIETIKGELYLVDDQILEKLDELESVPIRYRRDLMSMSFLPFEKDNNNNNKQGSIICQSNEEVKEVLQKYNKDFQIVKNGNEDVIQVSAYLYVCNIDLDSKFGGYSELLSDYTLDYHHKYVKPQDR